MSSAIHRGNVYVNLDLLKIDMAFVRKFQPAVNLAVTNIKTKMVVVFVSQDTSVAKVAIAYRNQATTAQNLMK
tara:strand:- start:55 stop:273 length:219 start_codon:yes stop_codon:yes gene_type:complete